MLMSAIEVITDGNRDRRWPASEYLRIVEEALYDVESISALTRRTGVAPSSASNATLVLN